MKKLMLGAAALLVAAAPLAASAQPWGHGAGGRGAPVQFRGGHDNGRGGEVLAAGLFGLVLGAALNSHPADYNQPYAYDNGYGPSCTWRTQAVEGPYGYVHYQQVRVCY